MAHNFTLDHSAGQKTLLVVICEAAGMAAQLARVANQGEYVIDPRGLDYSTDPIGRQIWCDETAAATE